jgi:hypothetical protein
MDHISLSIMGGLDYKDEMNYGVDIFINECNLLDIIREIELPYSTGNPTLAGAYLGLPPKAVFLPSRHFLDKPDPYYCDHGRRAIYRCGCGDVGCKPMLADITLDNDYVIWSNFENPWHSIEWTKEPWDYSSLKFTFERKQYESELSSVSESELKQYVYTR